MQTYEHQKGLKVNIKKLLFILSTFFTFQVLAADWNETLPLNSAEEKAIAFLKIRALIPTMTEGAPRYRFNAVDLLNKQIQSENIVNEISNKYQYSHENHELLQINIHEVSPPSDPKQLEHWNKIIENAIKSDMSKDFNTEESTRNEILNLLTHPFTGKTQGILTGLSFLVPPELRKTYFTMSIQDKISLLNTYLPHEIIANGFSAAKLGWDDKEISIDEIIRRLNLASQNDLKLQNLILIHFNLMGKFINPTNYLKYWQSKGQSSKPLENLINSNISKYFPKTSTDKAPTKMVLREVPPLVSIFRGFAGNDCSTLCSFPFVNSSKERTYLVYNNKGEIKGYVQGTLLQTEKGSTIYLHTIAGPRISKADSFQIVSALETHKEKIGFSIITFPPTNKLAEMVNFLPVQDAIRQMTTPEVVNLKYSDSLLRSQFKSSFQIIKSNDDSYNNPNAYLLNKSTLVSVQTSLQSPEKLSEIKTDIKKSDLFIILLQMMNDLEKNRPMLQSLANLNQINLKDVQDLNFILKNSMRLPTFRLFEQLRSQLNFVNIGLKDNYFEKNISLIAEGLLNCPDIQTSNPQLLSEAINALIDQKNFPVVIKYTERYPKIFKNSKLLHTILSAYYIDIHEVNFLGTDLLKSALKNNGKAIINNSDLLNQIALSEKSVDAIIDHLLLNPILVQYIPNDAPEIFKERALEQNTLLEFILIKLKNTKTASEFYNSFYNLTNHIKNTELKSQVQIQILSLTVDHFLTLNSKTEIHNIYILISNYSKSSDVQRIIRKLLPQLLQTSTTYRLNQYLAVAQQLKMNAAVSDKIDWAVKQGLNSQPLSEIEKLDNFRFFKHLIENKNPILCRDVL